MKRKRYFTYIITNKLNTTFYIGVTNDIIRRINEHKLGMTEGFTKKYKLFKLVHVEEFLDVNNAITREKQLKNWHREWKINLVKKENPHFEDLFDKILFGIN